MELINITFVNTRNHSTFC